MKNHSVYLVVVCTLLFASCAGPAVNNTNYAHLYSGKGNTINPDYLVYHSSKQETQLHFRINSSEILYARKDKTQPYFAKISLHYELVSPENPKIILDSATSLIKDETPKKTLKYLTGLMNVKIPFGKEYLLRVTATDLNRNNSNDQEIKINKKSVSDAQFFMMKDMKTEHLVYSNYTIEPLDVVIYSEENKGKKVHVHRYFRDFQTAAPPFSSAVQKAFDYEPDEKLTQNIGEDGTFTHHFADSGFVHFVMDTTQRNGLTFYGFDKNFPKIRDVFGMIPPLRYISTNNEFESLIASSDPKLLMDDYWLSKTGSEDRGREIIRKYYTRIEDANALFTSYVEGWKTDRGMVSIIFGTPKTVRKLRDEETWYYGEETNALALQFTFYEVDNPFTDNDYRLQRAPAYKSSWYRAVDAWRSGRVYWAQ